MRLIDADDLKLAIPETSVDAFQNCRNCVLLDKEQVKELIDAAPTIDIDRPTRSQFKRMAAQLGYEHVVCCKDCRFSGAYSTGKPFCTHPWGPAPQTKNDFCSYGERKENDDA